MGSSGQFGRDLRWQAVRPSACVAESHLLKPHPCEAATILEASIAGWSPIVQQRSHRRSRALPSSCRTSMLAGHASSGGGCSSGGAFEAASDGCAPRAPPAATASSAPSARKRIGVPFTPVTSVTSAAPSARTRIGLPLGGFTPAARPPLGVAPSAFLAAICAAPASLAPFAVLPGPLATSSISTEKRKLLINVASSSW